MIPAIAERRTSDILELCGRAAKRAAAHLRSLYRQPHQIRKKGRIDLVTEADVAAEEIILTELHKGMPGCAVLAEESAADLARIPAGPLWVIDPLDGTTNFAHDLPWFAVSIAYMEDLTPLAGVVCNVMADELYLAAKGYGAWCGDRRLQVSTADSLEQSLIATGFPYDVPQQPQPVLAALGNVLPRVQGIRRMGAAALDLVQVASGRMDGFWEIRLKPWDTAAGMLLVSEAGGRLSDFRGAPYNAFLPEIVASNGRIHDALQGLLAPFAFGRD
ncbi:MAG: inositol monophosphatase family protein [Thermodesulfobacteriota bacterium]